MFSQSKFTHNTHLFLMLGYLKSFPQLSRRGLSSLPSRHTSSPALTPATFHSFSAEPLSPPQQLEMRHFIMPPWCVRTKCNDNMRKNTYTQHTLDTLLYFIAKKPWHMTLKLSVFVCGLHIKLDTMTVHDWFSIRLSDITTLSFITECYSDKVWLRQEYKLF